MEQACGTGAGPLDTAFSLLPDTVDFSVLVAARERR